ncbi:RNA polymerase sigma factor [Actinomadura macrotermitis]|uniref:RNA polymerase sigma-70 region 2 domain-containing protein n=1 Tax=Actinomadura macrotermitis TaxID=2585200 RepID=A0A7K0BZA7_9ACTN|nr:sigma-70 family RNA polymerase sigma factor [Actinomadura macrotermitis]MQY06513.1 hypothetical protein [Actinomadura macrotermitis]
MSAWPSLDRLDDERLAHALAAGDPGALSRLVDRYAARLYDYCHALLRDQDAAAVALHDALLGACAHAALLQRPGRFRSWVYALVRNECLRHLRDPARPAERHEAPEVEDMFLDGPERAQRLETRRLVHGALAGLRGREREALDLLARHGLDPAEIGDVLGLPAQQATELVGAARARLDDALAAALIARGGQDGCPGAAAIAGDAAGGGESPLPPATVRKLVRHIGTCPVCGERRDRTVSTARLLQVLPVALMPLNVRDRILATAADPARAETLHAAVLRAEPFDERGWPVPLEPGEAPRSRGGHVPPRLLPAIAAAAVVMLLVTGAFMLMPGGPGKEAGAQSPATSAPAADPSATDGETDRPEPTPSATPTPTPSTTSPTPTPTTTSPTPTPHRTPTRKPPHASRTPEPTAPGTLVVNGCTIPEGATTCGITVRAVGGPVTWAVTGAAGVTASGGGRLRAGGTAAVTAARSVDCSADAQGGSGTVTFSPGGSAEVFWTCPQPKPQPKP